MNRSSHIAVKRNRHGPVEDARGTADDRPHGFADDDFEAIEEAVMATPRGRWFLSEYLRRHQNDETRRLVKALRKLARSGSEDVARYRAVLEQERAALDGIRLLLARTADELATEPAEPTLPEAAASRLVEILGEVRADAARMPDVLQRLAAMFRELARLLGEGDAEAAPAPDSRVEIVSAPPPSSASPAAPPAEADSKPRAQAARRARIVIRRHEQSDEVDIPLPESGQGDSHAARASGKPPRRRVRIRRQPGSGTAGVATMPQSANKVDITPPRTLAESGTTPE